MASESFIKDFFQSIITTFFRVIAFGVAIIVIILIFSVLASSPKTAPRSTTATVVPNHEWQVEPLSTTTPTLLKININGIIGLDHLTQDNVRTQLVDSINGDIKQEQIKGVLLAINTPGGTVDDSDGIYRLINEYKTRLKIPVYVYVDGMCASGGMYIACAADKIYASDASLVGHVGVLMPTMFNFSGLMEHLGIESKTFFTGKDKDAMNPFRPWTPNEGAELQQLTESFYQRFLSIVSKSRTKLTKESLTEQGAVIYPVAQAESLGYIDGTANTIDDMMKMIATELNIEKEYQVVELETKNWLDNLFSAGQACFKGKVEHQLRLPGDLHPDLYGKHLFLYRAENIAR